MKLKINNNHKQNPVTLKAHMLEGFGQDRFELLTYR